MSRPKGNGDPAGKSAGLPAGNPSARRVDDAAGTPGGDPAGKPADDPAGNPADEAALATRLAILLGRDAGALATLLPRYGAVQTLRSGRAFAWQDDPADRCALVLSGRLLPTKNRIGAPPIVLPPLAPGSWACLAESVARAPAQADYRARGDAELFVIPAYNLSLLEKRAEFAAVLPLLLARETLALHGWLLGGGNRERVVGWLLARRKTVAGIENHSIAATQADIAGDLGLARETVNRHLARLEAEGLLFTGRAEISVPDWAALEDSLRED